METYVKITKSHSSMPLLSFETVLTTKRKHQDKLIKNYKVQMYLTPVLITIQITLPRLNSLLEAIFIIIFYYYL
jgi:hypothetical protein